MNDSAFDTYWLINQRDSPYSRDEARVLFEQKMTFEKAYDARPKPLNMSIPLDGMYLYFYEAGQKELKVALQKIRDDYSIIDCRTWRDKMREIQNIAKIALEI